MVEPQALFDPLLHDESFNLITGTTGRESAKYRYSAMRHTLRNGPAGFVYPFFSVIL